MVVQFDLSISENEVMLSAAVVQAERSISASNDAAFACGAGPASLK
jgi:hypothetical protein